jgi:hypothetical protein
MARTSYANILALPDAAQAWNFDLLFTTIPGSSLAGTNLTYKCKTTSLPASSIEPVTIELHGAKKQEAGRAQYQHTFTAMFMETIDYTTYTAFRQWRDYMRSWKNNTGTNSQSYKTNLELDLYDNAGQIVETMILVGAFPTEVGEMQFNGAESTAIDLTMTFSFDYISGSGTW